jgi:hypothetical protein
MCIQVSLRIRGHWVKASALIDSGAEVNLIYPRLLGDRSLVQLDDHVTMSSLFNYVQVLGLVVYTLSY